MKAICRLVAGLFLLGAAAYASGDDREKDRSGALPAGARVAVVARNSSGGSHVDRVLGDMLVTALRRVGIRVVERLELDAVLREQNLARQGVTDPATSPPPGQVLGAQYLLVAKATEFGVKDRAVGGAVALGKVAGLQVRTSTARVALDVRLVDSRTSSVLSTATSEGKQVDYGGTVVGGTVGRVINLGGVDIRSREWTESSLGKAARKAVDDIVRKLAGKNPPLYGSVLAVLPGGEAIVSVGSEDGVLDGDRLELIRVEETRNAQGQVVWTDEKRLGTLRVVDPREDRSKAYPIERGLEIKEGDLVRVLPSSRRPRNNRANFDP